MRMLQYQMHPYSLPDSLSARSPNGFANCDRKFWRYDDFTKCFQHDYMQTLFPLAICGFSLLHLAIVLVYRAYKSQRYHVYALIKRPQQWLQSKRAFPQATSDDEHSHYEPSDASSNITDIDDEIERNAQLALRPTVSQINRTSYVEADKPTGQIYLVFVELLAALGSSIICTIAWNTSAWGAHGEIAAVAGIAVWAYVLVLIFVRLVSSFSSRGSTSVLWYHTTVLYGSHWLVYTLLLRSYLLHPPSNHSKLLMILLFVFSSTLFLISLVSRKGNKAVEIEYESDIPPAREPTASLLSLATFSWVDNIVWTGYKKTFELADVWNLPKSDKAAFVLSNFRQMKKTTSLAWDLLRFFRVTLLTQASWACLSGVLTFAPTLLVRQILIYVENPLEVPRTSAWLFVILLFVSGVASALADGQALWLGRHICAQSRAVIVGEIYAKALKRKIGSSADKVLGEDKPSKSESDIGSKIKSLFTKQQSEQTKPEDEDNKKPNDSDAQVTSGTIINLMAVDSFKISEVSAYLHFLWATAPVSVIMAIFLLYKTLGFSSIAGIGMMLLLLPLNLWIANRWLKIQKKILAATDARIHTTNEVLTNIRIIKYFAWELRFIDTINESRKTELRHLRNRYILWAAAATLWGGAPALITLLTFALYTFAEHKPLIPSLAFTALSLFQILRVPLDQLADMIAHVQECKVSIDRVYEFLQEEDTQKYKQLRHSDVSESDAVIGFDNAGFSWSAINNKDEDTASAFRLMDFNMRFHVGQLNIVAGPTGSGKTSLLLALLGEMTLLHGKVFLPGARSREDLQADPQTGLTNNVAYCAQQAWLVNGTVKDNIVFAGAWDPHRYNQVVRACALEKDLEILDSGDQTLIGEKGVTLSGGQKQRISLARALYCKAQHILLDDILSAVDSHTAKWIFDKAIMGPLMYNRTCILVTHNVSLCLPHADFVVLLDNGKVSAQGSAEDVRLSGKLDEDAAPSAQGSKVPSRVPSTTDLEGDSFNSREENGQTPNGVSDGTKKNPSNMERLSSTADTSTHIPKSSSAGLHETKAEGSVKLSIIIMYFKSMGSWFFWLVSASSFIMQQLSNLSTNVWIRQWANSYVTKEYNISQAHLHAQALNIPGSSHLNTCFTSGTCGTSLIFFNKPFTNHSRTTDNKYHVDDGYYLGIYAILAVVYMGINFFRDGVLFYGSLNASKSIHQKLITAVSRAKFRFFDTTPLGQIMNRFSKDIENVDQEVAPVAVGVLHCFASIVTILILISVVTPGFLIAGCFITVAYFLIGKFYINSSRDLKRLESVQRSPLYQQFGETLTGMTTIRAYNDERRFIRDNLQQVNTHNRPFLYLWASNRWLAYRVDIAGALVSFFTGLFIVLGVENIDSGAAGLALTYATTFSENVLWFVRLYAMNEQNMNSVERIKEYTDVDQEADAIIPDCRPPGDWPSSGAIEFVNFSTRYRKDYELVLKDLNFKIAPGEKVGIVGRTGAGKSSLALAMFRALEAEEGKILIDDIDISLIGLQDLRESIVTVPQDPTLFTGTIRSNLDPFGLFTDEEIFTALRRVQLVGSTTIPSRASTPKDPVAVPIIEGLSTPTEIHSPTGSSSENQNIFLNLLSPVAESGSNLSQGQRQLLCLARALLKSPKVLLMDEATASIDFSTDAKVQETIRELKDKTIITIAHRLKTIVDYDKVIVMDHGRVVEIGDPWELLKPDEGGHDTTTDSIEGGRKRWFREMCETSGDFEILQREAKRSWETRRLVDDS